ncbi:MAG: hypothetical protein ACTSWW_00805 [Promethearchaeota archaeon]
MTIEKLQKFLKNKYKFEKVDIRDRVEELDEAYGNFKKTIQEDEALPKIRASLSNLMLTILRYANTKDISLNSLAEDHFNA